MTKQAKPLEDEKSWPPKWLQDFFDAIDQGVAEGRIRMTFDPNNDITKRPASPPEEPVTEAERLAFVAGAKWWEVRTTGFSMWPSDQSEAYEAAPNKIIAMRRALVQQQSDL